MKDGSDASSEEREKKAAAFGGAFKLGQPLHSVVTSNAPLQDANSELRHSNSLLCSQSAGLKVGCV